MTQPRYERVPDICKIAVLRANALGDFIFILPAMEALRTTYPNAEIVLLAKQWHADFLKDRPGPIDRVIVVPPYGGVSEKPDFVGDADEHERFFTAMMRECFDLAIQLHGGGRYSNPFLLRLAAKMTIGLKTPDAVFLDRWMPYIYFQNETLRYKEAVSLVGATTSTLEPRLSVTKQDRDEAADIVADTGRPLVALHPGASELQRCWPVEKFAAVGDALAAVGAQVMVTGTKHEQHLVEGVVNTMRADALNVCNRLSLNGFAGLLSRCSVVISNDSGPLHLASAVGAATVGIYWCFNFINAGPFTRMRHRACISWQTLCPVCGVDQSRVSCEHRDSAVASISTEDVIEAALDLLYKR
ncbi:MAG: glycosyltransferase family 9 protein [Ktedonobacteraceae bacterium]